ncbi:MAG TPA: LuxR C-terminal-related transcriptional regulator [Gaiellaceae bacterium]
MSTPPAVLETAEAAIARCAWREAVALLREAAVEEHTRTVLERLAFAAWWLDDEEETVFAAREEAFRMARAAGDVKGAAQLAVLISWDHTFFRADHTVAEGWLSRAETLLEGCGECVERGWMLLRRAALLAPTDGEAAGRLADEALQVARAEEATDLEVAAISLSGLVLVERGSLEVGMRRLAEGAAAACGGETDHPVAVTLACCYTIGACERARDFQRAGQWVSQMVEKFDRSNRPSFASLCRAQYGAVLLALGDWREAGSVLAREAEALRTTAPSMASFALVRLAELRRRQGRAPEALALVEQAEPHPACLLVRAELALDSGRPDEAVDHATAHLRRTAPERVLERAQALELVVRAYAAAGAEAEAAAAAQELRSLVSALRVPAFNASARFATGIAAAAADELQDARDALDDAAVSFEQCRMPWEAAQAWRAAAEADARLGRVAAAARERGRSDTLLRELAGPRDGDLLSRREREVLSLVAAGLNDGGIAAQLVLSRHTVHRHVANAMRKLGTSTRAAAVARAAQLGLL